MGKLIKFSKFANNFTLLKLHHSPCPNHPPPPSLGYILNKSWEDNSYYLKSCKGFGGIISVYIFLGTLSLPFSVNIFSTSN